MRRLNECVSAISHCMQCAQGCASDANRENGRTAPISPEMARGETGKKMPDLGSGSSRRGGGWECCQRKAWRGAQLFLPVWPGLLLSERLLLASFPDEPDGL